MIMDVPRTSTGSKNCCVSLCHHSSHRPVSAGLQFHQFPFQDPERCAKWAQFIQRERYVITGSSRICSDHFRESDYIKMKTTKNGNVPKIRRLKHDAVPSRFHCSPENNYLPENNLPDNRPAVTNACAPSSPSTRPRKRKKQEAPMEMSLLDMLPRLDQSESEISYLRGQLAWKTAEIARIKRLLENMQKSKTERRMKLHFIVKAGSRPSQKCIKGRRICAVCDYRRTKSEDTNADKRGMLCFPKPSAVQYPQWLNAARDDHVVSVDSRVCSEHFGPDDFKPFKRGDKWVHRLKRGAVPSRLLPEKPYTNSPAERLYVIHSDIFSPAKRRRERHEYPAEEVTTRTRRVRSPLPLPRSGSPLQLPSSGILDPPDIELPRHPAGPPHHPIPLSVKEILCPLCGLWKDEPCWSHATTVADQAVLPYAVASLPQALYLGTSTDVSQGIFAKIQLDAQTVFGPLVWALVDAAPGLKKALQDQSNQRVYHFDLENAKLSNWMKFVRFVKNPDEQNMAVYFRAGKLYFVTTRSIQMNEELKVCYSATYANSFCSDPLVARTDDEQQMDNYPQLESFLPASLPMNEDPAVVRIPSGQLDIPFYPEENSLPCFDDTESQPNEAAEEVCSAGDWIIEREHAVLKETFLPDHPYASPTSVEIPLPMHLFNGISASYPVDPKPALLSPDVSSMTHSDVSLVPSQPAIVKNLKRKRKRRYQKSRVTVCELCGKVTQATSHQHMWKYHREYCTEHWKYQCPDCLEMWATESVLRAHITTSHPRPVTVLCQDSQAVQEAMEHVRTTGYLTYYCRNCQHESRGRHYPSKAMFDLHKLCHRPKHSMKDRPERSCPCCTYVAESFEDLMEHSITHAQDADGRLCIFCGQHAQTSIRDHVMEHHSEIMEEVTKGWEFECDECGLRFFRESLLRLHKKTHNRAASGYQCLYCAKVVYTPRQFGYHAAEHKINGAFKCPCCEKTFTKYPFMRNHYRDMHDIKSMKTCDICQEVLRNPQKLQVHMDTVHTSDRRTEEYRKNLKRASEIPRNGIGKFVKKNVLKSALT